MNKFQLLERSEFEKKYNYLSSTPMMQQYLDIKFEHQDCFLLFRMGDFYELFFDDAEKVSKVLGIALAKRGKIEDQDIPMCGVPNHALENYLPKLLETGVKVAICDQLESPEEAKKRGGYKAVVRRDVVRIITPGTVLENAILESARPSFLASIYLEGNEAYISYADITTGQFEALRINCTDLLSEISRIQPKEILVADEFISNKIVKSIIKNFENKIVFQPDNFFEFTRCKKHIESFYKIYSLDALGEISKAFISSVGVLIQYIQITQKAKLPKLDYPRIINKDSYMTLDFFTRRSLELTETQSGKRQGSLISVIDKTLTSGGGRILYNYISAPLNNISMILERQAKTDFFYHNKNLSTEIRKILKEIPDIDRINSKINSERCNPLDLLSLKNALLGSCMIKDILFNSFGIQNDNPIIKELHSGLTFDYEILDLIEDSIKSDAPINMNDGGYIKESFHPKLEELTNFVRNTREIIDNLKSRYQKLSNIESLRINHNNILGLFIEVSAKNAEKIDTSFFKYKQSTSTTVRYTTDELEEVESKIVNANSLSVALEYEIFYDICLKIQKKSEEIKKISYYLSIIDVFTSLAELAHEKNYTKPEINDSFIINIKDGRHSFVEHCLMKENKFFIPNDTYFSTNDRIILMTGPNMGGKSTYLRQVALITILAQIGSYVPAKDCLVGIVDKIFCRVGSGDDLNAGKSTFMVEMQESASILNNATEKSLIIFDEVGRGTSTYDGMSIAWAMIEYIYEKLKSRTLFATHYQELTDMSLIMEGLKNFHVSVEEKNNEISFTHKVKPGPADKSYGIHVAELAGVPKQVVKRATNMLKKFEKKSTKSADLTASFYENDIFSHQKNLLNSNDEDNAKEELLFLKDKISNFNINEITPIKALAILEDIQLSVNKRNK